MTREKFEEAKQILQEINTHNDRKSSLERLLERIKEVEPKTNDRILIKLGEEWIHTPKAEVELKEFKFFLLQEIKAIELYIKGLENAFSAL